VKIARAALLFCLLILVVFVIRLHSASAAPRQKVVPASLVDTRADKCRNALEGIQRKSGMWRSYQLDQNFGTVMVDSVFGKSSPKDKEVVNGLMRCVLTNGTGDESVNSIEYIDSTTHKPVALWSPYSGLELE
jgi:hypothetical protein